MFRTVVRMYLPKKDIPELLDYVRDHIEEFHAFSLHDIASSEPDELLCNFATSAEFAIQVQRDLSDQITRWRALDNG